MAEADKVFAAVKIQPDAWVLLELDLVDEFVIEVERWAADGCRTGPPDPYKMLRVELLRRRGC